MDSDVWSAILAMDAYNRQGALNLEGTQIGEATLLDYALPPGAANVSFFAQAYSYRGGIVISYRGTDNLSFTPQSDIVNGWPAAFGIAVPQVAMALQFYRSVAQSGSPVSVTGSSLGGGLAGLVASVYGLNATIFDNMPFGAMAARLARRMDRPKKSVRIAAGAEGPKAQISGYYVVGEFLSYLRLFETFKPQKLTGSPTGFFNPVDLHSQSLLVILLYGEKSVQSKEWLSVRNDLFVALCQEDLAHALGHVSANAMRSKIAYSAIDVGVRIFGDTAIIALFDDANDLGAIVSAPDPSHRFLATHGAILSRLYVQFASELVEHKIMAASEHGAQAMRGIFTLNEHFWIDLSASTWAIVRSQTSSSSTQPIFARQELVDSIFTDTGFFTMTERQALGALHVTDRLFEIFGFARGSSETAIDASNNDLNVILVGTSSTNYLWGGRGDDVVIGSDRRDRHVKGERLWGGAGDDVLLGGLGSDQLFGGEGNDLLMADHGFDTLDGGAGDDWLFVEAQSQAAGLFTLTGGDGHDRFCIAGAPFFSLFSYVGTVITDFAEGEDQLILEPSLFFGSDASQIDDHILHIASDIWVTTDTGFTIVLANCQTFSARSIGFSIN